MRVRVSPSAPKRREGDQRISGHPLSVICSGPDFGIEIRTASSFSVLGYDKREVAVIVGFIDPSAASQCRVHGSHCRFPAAFVCHFYGIFVSAPPAIAPAQPSATVITGDFLLYIRRLYLCRHPLPRMIYFHW